MYLLVHSICTSVTVTLYIIPCWREVSPVLHADSIITEIVVVLMVQTGWLIDAGNMGECTPILCWFNFSVHIEYEKLQCNSLIKFYIGMSAYNGASVWSYCCGMFCLCSCFTANITNKLNAHSDSDSSPWWL